MPPRVHYAVFMLLALAAFLVARQLIPRPRALTALPWRFRLALLLAAFIGGALGAKLPFVIMSLLSGSPAPEGGGLLADSAWFRDGKTITTGLVGAYVAVELTKLALGVRVKTGDTFALPLAVALVVGRWGCFFNGCCYGTQTDLPWGVWFEVPVGSGYTWMRCHPTQAYESLFHLAMACVLVVLLRRNWLRTHHLQLYLIAYGVYRFATEYIRPEPVGLLGLTFYQWVSVVMVVGLSLQWALERRQALSAPGEPAGSQPGEPGALAPGGAAGSPSGG
jgi:phosphatidylglycerol---prolipoprotein diacylglyceryl transferase